MKQPPSSGKQMRDSGYAVPRTASNEPGRLQSSIDAGPTRGPAGGSRQGGKRDVRGEAQDPYEEPVGSEASGEVLDALFSRYLTAKDEGRGDALEPLCEEHPELAEELRKKVHAWRQVEAFVDKAGLRAGDRERRRDPDPKIQLGSDEPPGGSVGEHASPLLERLADRSARPRYGKRGPLSKGGQGEILQVWDAEFRRSLAMKRMLRRGIAEPTQREVERFLEEAQVTGQLEHPGVVPVHDLGLDENGRLFFTMRLVRGRTLLEVLRDVSDGTDDWTRERALDVLLRVCETMAYAHDRGVVHRDLKPANVMVGRFGEVYVMDWGLARVLGRDDSKDVRPAKRPAPESHVWTDRREQASSSDSPLLTVDGDVIGTPAYMAPEQAEGRLDEIGTATDVYAVGAMLYQLLTGRVPYNEETGRTPAPHVVLRRVLDGPPPSIEAITRSVPPELVAIAERAMARDVNTRYPTMLELADELRAYRERRVVRAYRTGPLVELTKWVDRNRGVAASLAAVVLVAIAGVSAYLWNEARRTREIRSFAHLGEAESLLSKSETLGPIAPSSIPAMEAWCVNVAAFLSESEPAEDRLARLRERALPVDPALDDALRSEHPRYDEHTTVQNLVVGLRATAERLSAGTEKERLDGAAVERLLPIHEERLERLRREIEPRFDWRFRDSADARRHEQLAALVDARSRLERRAANVVEPRLDVLRSLQTRSVAAFEERWQEAIAAVAMDTRFGGLVMEPQVGLVPLGADPDSGLQEFWQVLTGTEPVRDTQGKLSIEEGSGVVLVLVPAGPTTLGASADPDAWNHDPLAPASEGEYEIELDPYFVSKYELTQSQWFRMTREVPNRFFLGSHWRGLGTISGLHPVSMLTWEQAQTTLAQWNLQLPSEAQWEHAARAGFPWPFPSGMTYEISLKENLADLSFRAVDRAANVLNTMDGHPVHAPVGTSVPNAFGLHDVVGNVSEMVGDPWTADNKKVVREAGTGNALLGESLSVSHRGGSYDLHPNEARVSQRYTLERTAIFSHVGIRPTRLLTTKERNQ